MSYNTQAPQPPQLHFPSAYQRPTHAPQFACAVPTADGAAIASFVYTNAAFTAHGARPTVLLLHGNGEEHGIFGPTIDALCDKGFRVVALDSRAQGKSTRGSAPLSYELMAEDALTVLDALGVSRAHVLGFSDGGIEALLLARDNPQRINSITVLGANLSPDGVIEEDNWNIDDTIQCNRSWAAWLELVTGTSQSPTYQTSDGSYCRAPYIDVRLMTPTAQEAKQTAELLELMQTEPHIPAESLSNISCPATIMAGEFDCIKAEQTQSIAHAIPHAKLCIVSGAGHTLPKEVPDIVTHELLTTIERARAKIDQI